MNTTENNREIAVFMGDYIKKSQHPTFGTYHESWDERSLG